MEILKFIENYIFDWVCNLNSGNQCSQITFVSLPQTAKVRLGFITWPNLGLGRLRMRNAYRINLLGVRHIEGGTRACDHNRASVLIAAVDGMLCTYICTRTTQGRCPHSMPLYSVLGWRVISIRTTFWREFLVNLLKINNSNRPGKLW